MYYLLEDSLLYYLLEDSPMYYLLEDSPIYTRFLYGKNISLSPLKMPTKYDTLLLIHVFKTNLSKKIK